MVTYEKMITLPNEAIAKIQQEWKPKIGETIHLYDDFTETRELFTVKEVNKNGDIRIDGEPLFTWLQMDYYQDKIIPLLSEEDFERYGA